jgi:hypothetical protein
MDDETEADRRQPHEGKETREGFGSVSGKTLKGKPQGRDRHETRPAGGGRMKASRARETPRRHRNPRAGNPGR